MAKAKKGSLHSVSMLDVTSKKITVEFFNTEVEASSALRLSFLKLLIGSGRLRETLVFLNNQMDRMKALSPAVLSQVMDVFQTVTDEAQIKDGLNLMKYLMSMSDSDVKVLYENYSDNKVEVAINNNVEMSL